MRLARVKERELAVSLGAGRGEGGGCFTRFRDGKKESGQSARPGRLEVPGAARRKSGSIDLLRFIIHGSGLDNAAAYDQRCVEINVMQEREETRVR